MVTFGCYLKIKRKQRELSVRKASESIGISHTYLASLEKGYDPRNKKERDPSLQTLSMIADFYEVDLATLINKLGYRLYKEEREC